MFALVDCNNFYVSCERVFRPDLNGKPVIVLSNNDGCIISRSNEAKKLDIPMAAAYFKIKDLLKKNNVHIFSSNYELYGDLSNRVMKILAEAAPEIEVYSIDEAFLKYEKCEYLDLEEHGLELRNKILKHTGLPVSIGFAPTKALSKIANKIAKKFPERTKGVYVIDSEEKRVKALKWTKINDVWGIGRKHTKRLKKIDINNAYDFTQVPDVWVKKHLAIVGIRLKRELEGQSVLDLEQVQDRKNIATTRSFEKDYTKFENVKERVITFAVTCARKLRAQKSLCNAMLIFIHTNGHKKEYAQYSQNIVIQLPYPTNSDIELAKFAEEGLQKIFKSGYRYKKAGVIVMDFTPENEQQLSLFNNSNPKHKQLMRTVDKLNKFYGKDKIKLGSQDIKRTWKMNQNNLSPRYTTDLKQIIRINSK